MCTQNSLSETGVQLVGTVALRPRLVGVKGRANTRRIVGVEAHGSDEFVNMPADVNAEESLLSIPYDMHSDVVFQGHPRRGLI